VRSTVWFFIALAAGALTFPGALPGQAARAALAQGVRAYDDLEFEAAAGLLRRALAVQGTDALVPNDHQRALMYLAATELLRDHRDTARAVARRLVVANPRYRPDELVFPPQVLQLYDDVRRATPAVIGRASADTAIRPGSEAFAVRLYASTVHDVGATLVAMNGAVVRTLHRGPVSDSLMLFWDGLDSTGTGPPPIGRYAITVASLDRTGRAVRIMRLPLEILRGPVDTLPHPPPPADSLLRRERTAAGPALRRLAPALLAGAAIAVLPALVADGEESSGGRFVIAGGVSIVGFAAFISRRPGRPIPANVAHNRMVRDWRDSAAAVARRNAARSSELMRIRVGTAEILTPSAP